MTSINHSNNVCLVTLHFPSSTPPPSSAASSSSTSSTGWTKKITKKIEELKKQQNDLKNLKNAKNGYLTDHDSKSLDSLPTQLTSLETVHKLAEFADQLDTNKNTSNNILKNLCTGLEKFLGFNSETKGYDGTGIVYSDLDRLCDGVMGFLSGVLEAVKDDENVKHYYPVTYMNNTIDCIKNSMHKGPSEYHSAVVAAAQALELWNGELVKRTKALTDRLDKLNNNYMNDMENALISLSSCGSSHVAVRLDNCGLEATRLYDAFIDAENEYKRLDETLKDKLQFPIDDIKLQVKSFSTAARNEELSSLLNVGQTKMSELSKYVIYQSETSLKRIQAYLEKWINNLKDSLHGLQTNQFHKLRQSVISNLEPAFNAVQSCMESLTSKYDVNVVSRVGSLREVSEEFNRQFVASKEGLKYAVIQVSADMDKLANLSKLEELRRSDTKLLQAVQKGEAFVAVDEYFTAVETLVMQQIRKIIEYEGWKSIIDYANTSAGEFFIRKNGEVMSDIDTLITQPLRLLKSALENDDLKCANIKIEGIDNIEGMKNLDVRDYISRLDKVIQQLDSSQRITNEDIKSLLSAVGSLTGTVATHARGVVEEVTKAIQRKVKAEIEAVGSSICAKVAKIEAAVTDATSLTVDYGLVDNLSDYNNRGPGLEKLVKDFKNHIDAALLQLRKTVGTKGDKKTTTPDSVYAELNDLQLKVATLSKHVEDVKRNVNEVGTEMASCLADVNALLIRVPLKTEEIMNVLRDEIDAKIQESVQLMQEEAKDQYDRKIRKMLADTQIRVQYASIDIKRKINEDLSTGVKGLLRTMYKEGGRKLTELKLEGVNKKETFRRLSERLKDYLDFILKYVQGEVKTPMPSPQPAKPNPQSTNVNEIENAAHKLFDFLAYSNHFDFAFKKHLASLHSSLGAFNPKHFVNVQNPLLLDVTKRALSELTGELGKAYVNAYSGAKLITWEATLSSAPVAEGKNAAKVCLSALRMLHDYLSYLRDECETKWKHKNICLVDAKNIPNDFGHLLRRCGYGVPSKDGVQDDELKCHSDTTGNTILQKLGAVSLSHSNNHSLLQNVECLFEHLHDYYKVGHIGTLSAKRRPCSVYDMTIWLNGLTYNPVYQHLFFDGFGDLFDKPDKAESDSVQLGDVSVEDLDDLSLASYPQPVTYSTIHESITHITSMSHLILTTVVGTGDEFTMYACDYSNNSMQFQYPASGQDCLDMLLDIYRRLLPSLRFMYTQCGISTKHHGWQNCKYGKDIKTSKWPCKEHPTDQPIDEPNDEPNDQSNCQPNSPLMSYLNDCLPGHLPHQLTKIGCKFECTTCSIASKKGMLCLPPLGFRGFSGSIKTGKDICNVLAKFFSNDLTWSLFCLSPKPPKTLAEHFGFTLSLVSDWLHGSALNKIFTRNTSLQHSFESCIRQQSIQIYSKPSELTSALMQTYGSQSVVHESCGHPQLKNMVQSDDCRKHASAPYLHTLCSDANTYLAKKQSDLYLSWAIYLPWDFWQLLKNLFDAFCSINCQDWSCRGCLRGDKCKKGEHGVTSDDKPNAICQCPSIVQCKGVSPTLYQYGFRFGDSAALNSEHYPKSCSNFCQLLDKMLQSNYFTELFNKCDDFLFKIRAPFIWLNVALWLLSFLYLLNIMVIRLDLLHIKSHLHSPSSHRIAAQSLLAAGRVNKLNRVFYLQP